MVAREVKEKTKDVKKEGRSKKKGYKDEVGKRRWRRRAGGGIKEMRR